MKYKYRLAQDTINKEDIDALCEWLQGSPTPQLTKGKLTPIMEKAWASWVGQPYGVFCNSGSSANLLAAYALKVSNKLKNNKVIVCDVGWVTTVAPFIQFEFDIIMCGTDYKNFGINLDKLEALCQEHDPGTVIFVQPLGVLVDKDRLHYLKMKYGFYLIEDSCAALGSVYGDGTKAGAVGDISTFSLFFAHQASTLEGGLIFTNNKELYNILVSLRSHGWLRDLEPDVYDGVVKQEGLDDFNKPFTFIYPGFNLRATDLQAFIGLRQLDKLDGFAIQRDNNHKRYEKELYQYLKCQTFDMDERISSISFACLAKSKEQREKIVQALLDNGIETRMYSAGALHRHKFWKDYENTSRNIYKNSINDVFDDQISNDIHDCGFFLPNTHVMKEEDVLFIVNVVKEALGIKNKEI